MKFCNIFLKQQQALGGAHYETLTPYPPSFFD